MKRQKKISVSEEFAIELMSQGAQINKAECIDGIPHTARIVEIRLVEKPLFTSMMRHVEIIVEDDSFPLVDEPEEFLPAFKFIFDD